VAVDRGEGDGLLTDAGVDLAVLQEVGLATDMVRALDPMHRRPPMVRQMRGRGLTAEWGRRHLGGDAVAVLEARKGQRQASVPRREDDLEQLVEHARDPERDDEGPGPVATHDVGSEAACHDHGSAPWPAALDSVDILGPSARDAPTGGALRS
jgi:hypothetical protein